MVSASNLIIVVCKRVQPNMQKATILSSCRHRSRLCLLQYIDMHGRSGDTVARPQHSTRCCNSENNNCQSGSRNSILDYNHETNAVTCFACRQFCGSSPLCVTDWKNATSFRIYIWVLRLQMMQSLQSTSTQSSRGLSKVSAY